MPTHLVWFRRDLRLQDNLALAAACRDASARVLALYISTPAQWQAHDMAPRQAAFISAQLNALQAALQRKAFRCCFMKLADF
ncbi:deoxyribodipyrimidine photolyase [Salmonella enterica subsp. enterica]|uniref:Deoxyribodipyrimidine photolyase n=1 Tax=Salmonella enterica I TaxID=59201 RepID=A0A379VU04_SALET|nr:deoxyribodipyrimidine photolyase [Salmonella enterica subsp. enterica]